MYSISHLPCQKERMGFKGPSEQNEKDVSHGSTKKVTYVHRNVQTAPAEASDHDPVFLLEMIKIREDAMIIYSVSVFFVMILAFCLIRRSMLQKKETKKEINQVKGKNDNTDVNGLQGAFPPSCHGPSVRSDMIWYDDDEDLTSVHLDDYSLGGSKKTGNHINMKKGLIQTTAKSAPSTVALGVKENKRLKLPPALSTWEESLNKTKPCSSSSDSHHSRHQAGRNNDPSNSSTMGGMFLKMMKGDTSSSKMKHMHGSNHSRSAFLQTSRGIDPTTRPRFRTKSKESDQSVEDSYKKVISSSSNDSTTPSDDASSHTVMVVPFPGVTIPPEINRAEYS